MIQQELSLDRWSCQQKVQDSNEKVAKQKQQQIIVTRNRRDLTDDNAASFAVRTLGKMVQTTAGDGNVFNHCKNNTKIKTCEESLDDDDEDDDEDHNSNNKEVNDDYKKNKFVNKNNGDVSHSGFSNGSYHDNNNNNAGQHDKNKAEHTNTQINKGKETYEEELLWHSQNTW